MEIKRLKMKEYSMQIFTLCLVQLYFDMIYNDCRNFRLLWNDSEQAIEEAVVNAFYL